MVDDILSPGGAVSRRLGDRFEARPEQIAMAHAVQKALLAPHHLLAEAGTGVGKSFAYLVPAIELATRHKKRVVISTHTINLQEQLFEKDIPLLASVWPDEFSAVLVKGRNNYLCKRRLQNASAGRMQLFDEDRQIESLALVEAWADSTTDGSLATLPQLPRPGVWEEVRAEHGNCMGKRCEHYNNCFWQAAKRRMNSGNILIVNHALFFSDLALRSAGVQYLPKYDAVIFDEAHTIEDVASQHFAIKLSESSLRYQLRQLFDPRRSRGLLTMHGTSASDAANAVLEASAEAEVFFHDCARWQEKKGRGNGRIHEPNIVESDLAPRLADCAKLIKALLKNIEKPDQQMELSSKADRLMQTAQTVEVLVGQQMPDAVYWMELSKRSPQRVTLSAAPVDVSSGLRRHLFEPIRSVILTSATLCTRQSAGRVIASLNEAESTSDSAPGSSGPIPQAKPLAGVAIEGDGGFGFAARRLGVDEAMTLQVGSPFDYAEQATLYLETNLPDPNEARRFVPAACERIEAYVRKTDGGAFVLFTSFSMLRQVAEALRPTLEHLGMRVLVQGESASPRQLLDEFRKHDRAVLFGTSSFWQGVDVQGDRLRNVIIVKLPFSVPDEPITEARLEHVQKMGGNPFMQLSLPEAIIRFRQGFGRLIRSRADRGIVVVLDSRVKTKRYGRMFLDALPAVRVVEVAE
jgi:ATP-dependent DNA helicase DinG